MKIGSIVGILVAVFIPKCCRASNFMPLVLGQDFVTPFGVNDLLRGFKLNREEGESAWKAKPFSGISRARRFATEYTTSSILKNQEAFKDFMGIEGSFSLTYGPVSGSGAGRYFENNMKTSNSVKVIYTRRSAAYAQSVDMESLQPSAALVQGVCGGTCTDTHKSAIAAKFGTKFVDQIIYGSQLDMIFTVTSEDEIGEREIEAELGGSIGVSFLKASFKAKFSTIDSNVTSQYKVEIEAKASGVNFAIPSNPTFEEVVQVIDMFNNAYEDSLNTLSSFATIDEETNVLKMLTPVGFTLASTGDYFTKVDKAKAVLMEEKMAELSDIWIDSIYRRSELANELEKFRNSDAHDDPRFRNVAFVPYRVEVAKQIELLDNIIQECLAYRRKTIDEIVNSPLPTRFGYDANGDIDEFLESSYYGLMGIGYIAPPLSFGDDLPLENGIYYTGYAIPNTTSVQLSPHFSGKVYNDLTDEGIASGNTTKTLYKNYLATKPNILPRNHIGYKTPFVMQMQDTYFTKFSGSEFWEMMDTDIGDETVYAETKFALDFCSETAATTELQFLANPNDLLLNTTATKNENDCVKYGDMLYIALADATEMGNVFLTPDTSGGFAGGQRLMLFKDPMNTGDPGWYRFKVESTIPFNKDFTTHRDPLAGECIDMFKGFNVHFQNDAPMDHLWLMGAETVSGNMRSVDIFKSPEVKFPKYKWSIQKYADARLKNLCETSTAVQTDGSLLGRTDVFTTGDGRADCPSANGLQTAMYGIRASGEKARNNKMICRNSGKMEVNTTAPATLVDRFSEEEGLGECNRTNSIITGIQCEGDDCDYLALYCHQLSSVTLDYSNCGETSPIPLFLGGSGYGQIPEGAYAVGVRCLHGWCSQKRIKYCYETQYDSSLTVQTEEFTSGFGEIDCPSSNRLDTVMIGLSCSGFKCANLRMTCFNSGTVELDYVVYGTPTFSEEVETGGSASCPGDNQVIVGLSVDGENADNISLYCRKLMDVTLSTTNCHETGLIPSVEDTDGYGQIPVGSYPTSMSCHGPWCAQKKIGYCWPS